MKRHVQTVHKGNVGLRVSDGKSEPTTPSSYFFPTAYETPTSTPPGQRSPTPPTKRLMDMSPKEFVRYWVDLSDDVVHLKQNCVEIAGGGADSASKPTQTFSSQAPPVGTPVVNPASSTFPPPSQKQSGKNVAIRAGKNGEITSSELSRSSEAELYKEMLHQNQDALKQSQSRIAYLEQEKAGLKFAREKDRENLNLANKLIEKHEEFEKALIARLQKYEQEKQIMASPQAHVNFWTGLPV